MPIRLAQATRRLARAAATATLFGAALAGAFALPAPAQQSQRPGQGQGQGQGQGTPRPTEVGVMVLQEAVVPVSTTLPGRAVSPNATVIRPRVGGAITEILFTPGTRVEPGTPLFRIDPVQHEAALASARAALERARAALPVAETAFDRARTLAATAAASRSALDNAEAEALKARADVAKAEADLRLAEAQLSWTTITAPVGGVIGVPLAAVGDVVTANQAAALADLVQIDPIYVDVTEPTVARLRLEASIAAGEITPRAPDLRLTLETGAPYDHAGTLVSPGPTVSTTTATRVLRFSVPNPDARILPGMFLRGDLSLGETRTVLVPQRATERAPDGSLTAFLVEDGVARKRVLVEAGTHDNAWIIRAGASAGDVVVIDGLARLRDGAPVTTVPVAIDASGVVRDLPPDADQPAQAQPEAARKVN
ncbi:efflux RND transporter periplasmic adaptor subunit [Phaeovulum sp. NW3]|uniref:efflux RND transporter periplasmic adaptor subunit n=1 Tax=Phaeovulum sp. NW3 TaxID=2934933 RepID=UPI0020204FA9|nr:efflux RND transporter periplasmic adaptor subunit [Phaeovulum sp. NW3]MCL7464068.1 efflux RND transporter periplasmic adaptor subunit [Phaeovulum sp. NW3]